VDQRHLVSHTVHEVVPHDDMGVNRAGRPRRDVSHRVGYVVDLVVVDRAGQVAVVAFLLHHDP